MDINSEVKREIYSMTENNEYRKFTSSLLPGVDNILGVRLPNLRKLSKKIYKDDWRTYLKHAADDTFEEIMVQGMVIGNINTTADEILQYISWFVPKINNWSICDSFCAGLKKSVKKYPEQIWLFLKPYLTDDREYYLRFGIVMLLMHYINEQYIEEVLEILKQIDNSNYYYVKMAIAWAVSVCFIKFPKKTMEYLIYNDNLDSYTYNKSLQKITESSRVDDDTKKIIRSMKR